MNKLVQGNPFFSSSFLREFFGSTYLLIFTTFSSGTLIPCICPQLKSESKSGP